MTKLGNATLFGHTGSFVFAVYGLCDRAPPALGAPGRSPCWLAVLGAAC